MFIASFNTFVTLTFKPQQQQHYLTLHVESTQRVHTSATTTANAGKCQKYLSRKFDKLKKMIRISQKIKKMPSVRILNKWNGWIWSGCSRYISANIYHFHSPTAYPPIQFRLPSHIIWFKSVNNFAGRGNNSSTSQDDDMWLEHFVIFTIYRIHKLMTLAHWVSDVLMAECIWYQW